MLRNIRSKLVKALSFIDYMNKEDDLWMKKEIEYDESNEYQGRVELHKHIPSYQVDKTTYFIIESKTKLNEFMMKHVTHIKHHPVEHRKYKVINISPFVNEGKTMFFVVHIKCDCTCCMFQTKDFDSSILVNEGFEKENV